MKVYIVLEGPDMTYYGDAEIHGVYATLEQAEARARELWPDWKPEDGRWLNHNVSEYDVEEPRP